MGRQARIVTTSLTCLMLAMPLVGLAWDEQAFPGAPLNVEAMQVREKAEASFEKDNFKRAYFLYRNELAPMGDKYSQYMVGYMHLVGQGVPADRATAAAWYRLAAERGTRQFVKVYKQLAVSLTPEQIAFFHEQGYLAGVRLLNDAQVDQLCEELEDLVNPDWPGCELFHEYHSNESTDPSKVLFHALGAWRTKPGFHDLLESLSLSDKLPPDWYARAESGENFSVSLLPA